MKKLVVSAMFLVVAAVGIADDGRLLQSDIKKMSYEERKAYSEKMRYAHTGGEIARPGTVKGEVVVVDCRSEAADGDISDTVADLRKSTKISIRIGRGKFDMVNPKIEGGATLFVVDDEKLPMSLIALESRWACVNVAPLRTGRGASPAFFKARVKKSVTRTFASLCGAMSSNFKLPIMGGVFKPEDLDNVVDSQLPPDVVTRFAPYLAPIGVVPGTYVSYRRACQEGWAPSPTNDVQKTVWNEVHELPKAPLKLEK